MFNYKDYFSNFNIKSEDALKAYINLIDKNLKELYEGEDYAEMHHILPKCLFPEFKSESDNIVKLKYDEHILAHKLLMEIYEHDGLRFAYYKMKGLNFNPNQLPTVREKIRQSKLGKPRPDIKGKKYFGASDEKAKIGIEKMKTKLKNTIVVKDKEGNKFRVSVNDDRYISGELVPFWLGEKRPNSGTRNKLVLGAVLVARQEKYNKILSYSKDELVDYMVKSYNAGKKLFTKKGNLHSNFSRLVNEKFDKNDIKNLVVQRLGLNP